MKPTVAFSLALVLLAQCYASHDREKHGEHGESAGSGGASDAGVSERDANADSGVRSAFCDSKMCNAIETRYERDLQELAGCTVLTGDLVIPGGAYDIINLDALACLETVEGDVYLDGINLAHIGGLIRLTSIAGSLFIGSWDLASLHGLENLSFLGGYLAIENCTLTNLDELANLSAVNGYLLIKNCPSLTDVDGLSGIDSIQEWVLIEDADTLDNIDGLTNLTSVGGSMRFWDIPRLPSCDAETLRKKLGKPADNTISGGDAPAMCGLESSPECPVSGCPVIM